MEILPHSTQMRLDRFLLACAVSVAACAPSVRLPDEAPDIVGTITSVHPPASPEGRTRVRIETNPAEESGSPKMVLAIDRETRILDASDGGGTRPVGIEALRVGDRVRAWVTGPIMESYPSQGTAGTIVLDGGPDGATDG
jgi:hypothetical protein